MKYLRWVFAAIAVVVVALSTTSCNTIRGMGQDIEKGGEAIEETAEDAKN